MALTLLNLRHQLEDALNFHAPQSAPVAVQIGGQLIGVESVRVVKLPRRTGRLDDQVDTLFVLELESGTRSGHA